SRTCLGWAARHASTPREPPDTTGSGARPKPSFGPKSPSVCARSRSRPLARLPPRFAPRYVERRERETVPTTQGGTLADVHAARHPWPFLPAAARESVDRSHRSRAERGAVSQLERAHPGRVLPGQRLRPHLSRRPRRAHGEQLRWRELRLRPHAPALARAARSRDLRPDPRTRAREPAGSGPPPPHPTRLQPPPPSPPSLT